MEITEILDGAGYVIVEGKDAVLNMIKSASDGSDSKLCSGFGVYPDGDKCNGCLDCKSK